MRSWKRLLVGGLFLCSAVPALFAQTVEIKSLNNPEPAQVLFVGNSYFYYNDSLHNHVNRLVQAQDKDLAERIAYKSATIGGASLSHHDVTAHLEPGRVRYTV